ncbi:Hypothetical protein PHPALM_20031 [Phytophthora palmivora]|uniref:Uncharacterized protein n=1 Tax=Phytophthora palmivora TaxID=4796 RepID=A0A2P4XFV7_9STRA|nr:Hypothetical protein PHPALM_20031 [Phytophthora palmivora]
MFTPSQLVDVVNKINRPSYVEWGVLLKYFISPPPGYTSNYLFDIDQGICTARSTINTSDENATPFAMIDQATLNPLKKL